MPRRNPKAAAPAPTHSQYHQHLLRFIRCELSAFAVNSIERCVADYVQKQALDLFHPAWNSEQRCFFFKAYFVPCFWEGVIRGYEKGFSQIPLWLGEPAAYVVALERMCLEFVWLSRQRRKAKTPSSSRNPKKLVGMSVQEWFEAPPNGHGFWLWRFQEWRKAATRSFQLYFKKQLIGQKASQPDLMRAAFLGGLQHIGGMPDELLSSFDKRFLSQNLKARRIYRDAVKRLKPPRWKYDALDTWLIEIWPLVTAYAWNYHDVWKVASMKFDSPEDYVFSTATAMEEHCKDVLGLSLGATGQAKRGRPPGVHEYFEDNPPENQQKILPHGAGQALFLQSIALVKDFKKWIGGSINSRISPPLEPANDGDPNG